MSHRENPVVEIRESRSSFSPTNFVNDVALYLNVAEKSESWILWVLPGKAGGTPAYARPLSIDEFRIAEEIVEMDKKHDFIFSRSMILGPMVKK